MLKTLLKKQMMEINRSFFFNQKKGTARTKTSSIILIILYALLMVVVLGGTFAGLSFVICEPFHAMGMDWFYFMIMGSVAILLGVFGGVFSTYMGLYKSKDNDLLLSMPIPVRSIFVVRLLGVYLMGLLFSAVVIVPAIVVYWIVTVPTVAVVVGGVATLLLISLFVLVLSCLLGWVVAKISSKVRHKSFVSVLASLTFLGLYYFFYFKAANILDDVTANVVLYGEKVRGTVYPLYMLGRVGAGDWSAIGIVTVVVLALVVLTYRIMSRNFIGLATTPGAVAKTKYVEKKASVRSPSGALLYKEAKRFTASPNYMLNCGLGILLMPAAGILLLIKGQSLTEALSLVFTEDVSAVLFTALACMVVSMNTMSAASVSLEGKNLWLAQSLPVSAWQVLQAKLRLYLLLTVIPAAILCVCGTVVFSTSLLSTVEMIVIPSLYAFVSGCFGLFLNLRHPNLHWTNEVTPVKQSLSVTLALFGGWIYGAIIGGAYLLFAYGLGTELYLLLVAAVIVILALALYMWLRKRGAKLFTAL